MQNRRDFLKGTAWMGAAAALSGCVTKLGGTGTMSGFAVKPIATLRTAHIGVGMRGPAAVHRMSAIPGTRVTAICDLWQDRVDAQLKWLKDNGKPEAKGYVAQFGLAERIECRAGDYHADEYEAEAYDVVTIFGALHQESPEQIVDILKRANRALKPGGRLLVLDMMTDATHTAPKFSALFAVNMALTTANGWVFSDEELKGWMKEAGFTPEATQIAPPPMPHWLVTARKD